MVKLYFMLCVKQAVAMRVFCNKKKEKTLCAIVPSRHSHVELGTITTLVLMSLLFLCVCVIYVVRREHVVTAIRSVQLFAVFYFIFSS